MRIAWAECELNLFADDIGFEKARDVFDLFMFCLTLNSAADKRGFMTEAMNKPARGDFQERCHSLAAFQAAWINGSA